MRKLQDLTVKEFLEKTAANEAVPGGGSNAALNAAIATALTGMVANLTIGRKKYAGVEERMKQIAAEMSEQRSRFMEDIDRDAEAYRLVMEAYRLPKETDEEITTRNEKIQEATKIAALVPMEVAERAFGLLGTMRETLEKGNPNAATDGLVGLMNCRTAILSALLNVRINLGSITDRAFVDKLTAACDRMEKETMEQEMAAISRLKSKR
ncbi:MAG: Glutamate formimidoyltransferase [Proteiniphilum acetatigenes]|uniref:Glutamate formimidoyltransferase n=1 Tax=Proteiniphilum acetatigenes TaxID=294710 RepID=A0A101HKX7_9BACT|nr:MAG: Glutamate formimidoyltransferase [Proteiniphilum acetatigenes]HCC85827.1 methenyltetrahydrofolate cyclohydrolase [Porphyromonadaceae bacterium]